MKALCSNARAAPVGEETVDESDTLLAAASLAANKTLNRISRLVSVKLVGRARKNLGTALRVKEVRALLEGVSTSAGDDLITELEYIAAAADAGRHLSVDSIILASEKLNGLGTDADIERAQFHYPNPYPNPPPPQPVYTLTVDKEKNAVDKEKNAVDKEKNAVAEETSTAAEEASTVVEEETQSKRRRTLDEESSVVAKEKSTFAVAEETSAASPPVSEMIARLQAGAAAQTATRAANSIAGAQILKDAQALEARLSLTRPDG